MVVLTFYRAYFLKSEVYDESVESKNLYGNNKVLRGMHMATKVPDDKIPLEIREIVGTLSTLSLHSWEKIV